MSNTIIFVMIISSITSHCHLENYQLLANEKFLALRAMISCSHSSVIVYECHLSCHTEKVKNFSLVDGNDSNLCNIDNMPLKPYFPCIVLRMNLKYHD